MASLLVGLLFTLALLAKSVADFSRTGPQLRREVLANFRTDAALAVARLSLWAFVVSTLLSGIGVLALWLVAELLDAHTPFAAQLAAGAASLAAFTTLRFAFTLYFSPATIVASWNYSQSRFNRLLRHLTAWRLRSAVWAITSLSIALVGAVALRFVERGHHDLAATIALAVMGAFVLWWRGLRRTEPRLVRAKRRGDGRLNVLLIGSDTLRADRLGVCGYFRSLTPHIDALARRGTLFRRCYVPCARTAPSLVSLLTGCWPHRHRIRDNFVSDAESELDVPRLPQQLLSAGYSTVAVGDWAAGDLRKFNLGFEVTNTSNDQWNIKYLLRQGPKDLRLFLSLWLSNRIGKRLLPEIYYLAGVPRTREMGIETRSELSRLAAAEKPFLLAAFMASTHPPFGSEAPYYRMFSDPNYTGESMFAMARLTDPFEIIRRQGEAKKEFDLEQIEDLYDGCVRSFDNEVGRILAHLDRCGLTEDTIVVLFSDHGMEFFEHETWGQGNSVFGDQSSRVPLIIADPRQRTGTVVEDPVRTIDVAPTLLSLLDENPSSPVDGTDLAACVQAAAKPPALTVLNETGIWLTDLPGTPAGHLRYPDLPDLLHVPDTTTATLAIRDDFKRVVVAAKDRMVLEGNWKLTYQPLQCGRIVKLFDLRTDPECRHDVSQQHPEVKARLERALDAWLQQDGLSLDCTPDFPTKPHASRQAIP